MKVSCFICDYPAVVLFARGAIVLAQSARAANHSFALEALSMNHPERDRAAIIETIENIARGVDLHQWNSVTASFAQIVLLDAGTIRQLSPSRILARWKQRVEAFDATQHLLSNTEVSIDEGRAKAHSRFLATYWLRGAAGGDLLTLEGICDHDLQLTDDGWRITAIRIARESSFGNPLLIEEAKRRRTSNHCAATVVAGRADGNPEVC